MAIVAGSRCSSRAKTKAIITTVSTARDCLSNLRSKIASAGIMAMTRALRSGIAFNSLPHTRWVMMACVIITTMMTGAKCMTKALKSRPTCEPIRMLGGSPINVAVPPMFDARISANRNG